MGVTILSNAGLEYLVAQSVDEYISKAVELACNHEELRRIRKDLRGRVRQSPIMDSLKFTKDLENAYRDMWRIWIGEHE
jgi:predicted O-linked N-acetylglucosamine transferase (SPINDLY family)